MFIDYDMGMDLDIDTGLNIIFVKNYDVPSQAMEPIIKRLAEEFEDICFTAITADEVDEVLAEEYNIRFSPTIVFLQDGNMLYKIQGTISENNLRDKINRILK